MQMPRVALNRFQLSLNKEMYCQVIAKFLLDFLETTELCLPCTTKLHRGDQATWTSPDGLTQHRIDFVAVPQTMLAQCTWSSILPSLDQGTVHGDHTAAVVQLEWYASVTCRSNAQDDLKHDRIKIRSLHSALDFKTILQTPWHADIESHVQQVNQSLLQELQRVCPCHSRGPKKNFLDASIWELRKEKLQLRKQLKQARAHRRFDLMARIFKSWDPTFGTLMIFCNLNDIIAVSFARRLHCRADTGTVPDG